MSCKEVRVQPAYILHARPFRETSLLLEVFSRDYGRVSMVARSARGNYRLTSKKTSSRFNGLLQPFIPLLISWSGKGPLFNLTHAEPCSIPPYLVGRLLKGGWYMNELLMRTLGHWDSHTKLFLAYQDALYKLNQNFVLSLRQFEKSLLMTLGVLPQLNYDKELHPVQSAAWYTFSPLYGVTREKYATGLPNSFQGAVLLAAHQEDWGYQAHWPSIKRLFRLMLDEVLSGQSVRSRELLQATNTKPHFT